MPLTKPLPQIECPGRRRFLLASGSLGITAMFPQTLLAQGFWDQPRYLHIKRAQTGETVRETYWANGQIVRPGYERICHVLRDVQAGVKGQMTLRVLDILAGTQGWFRAYGQDRLIIATSGKRTPKTNSATEGAAKDSQTPAIEAGKPFAQMQRAGMATAVMGDIIRQKNQTLKAAVQLAAAGRAKASLSRIEEVVEIKDEDKRYQALANRYAQMSPEERAETLIVTGTNASRNAINEACHVERGLAGQGRDYTLLTRRDTTQAERRYAKYYAVGDVIQPERDYACGLLRGEMYRVIGAADDHQLRVCRLTTGEVIDFLPSKTQKLSVYEPVQAELSVGDWVRMTRNDAGRDIANGERFEVASISASDITIAAGGRTVSLPADAPLHIDRAYATTVHSAQGLTCDRVIINAESFSRTTKQDVYYVGISRARHEAVIYTNDQKKLPEAVARREEKSAALELVSQKQRGLQRGHAHQHAQAPMQAAKPVAGMELGQ
ncbi:ATP-dependent RecD-like DNA helicase [Castellaniella defragrans]